MPERLLTPEFDERATASPPAGGVLPPMQLDDGAGYSGPAVEEQVEELVDLSDAPRKLSPLGLAAFNSVFWPYLFATTALAFFPTVGLYALRPIDKQRNLLRRFTEEWGAHYLERAPFAGVTVIGRERVDFTKPTIFVANHESMVDILAIMSARLPALWVSKIENFYAPVLGFNMLLNGYIPVRRGYFPSILRMVRTCLGKLKEGRSLIVFPEGTRSEDGNLRPFFRGAFMLAAYANVPIVPIVHVGTRDVLNKGSFVVRPRRVTLKFLDPIHPSIVDHDSRRLRDVTRSIMATELARLRGRPIQSNTNDPHRAGGAGGTRKREGV